MIRKKTPKSIVIIGYKILNWLYYLIIPILKKKYKCNFVVIASDNTKEKFLRVLDKRDDVFIALDSSLENIFIKGYGKIIKEEEYHARKNEVKYNLNYMRDIIQQDRSLSS